MSGIDGGADLEGSLLHLIAEAETFEDALEATLRLACDAGGWEYGEAWFPEDGVLVAGATYDPERRFAAFSDASATATFEPDEGLVGRALESRSVVWLDGLDSRGTFVRAGAATAAGFESSVAVPIVDGDAVVAVLAFFTTHDRAVDDEFAGVVADAVSKLSRLFARTRRRQAEAGERALLDGILRTSPVGIIVHDPETGTDRANPAAASILGVDVDTVLERGVGSEAWDVYDESGERIPVDAFPFAAAMRRGAPVVDERVVVGRPDGTEVTLSVNAAPVLDEDGEVVRVLVAFSDVSERAKHEAELEEKNRQLESFTSVLSHDIRSPLAVATGFLELARETGDLEYLEKVERSHERIEELVDTLLVLARKGRMVGTRRTVDLAEAAREAWEVTKTEVATLEVGDVRTVDADPARLKQVFENLFRNSVEHGSTSSRRALRADDSAEHGSTGSRDGARRPDDSVQHGGGGVTVRVVPLDDEPGFAVEDDGPGIPPDRREEVLRPGHESAGGGFGLGLSIVAAVAEGHGWSLRATESTGGGARFEFRTAAGE